MTLAAKPFARHTMADFVKDLGDTQRDGQPNPVPCGKELVERWQLFPKGAELGRQKQRR